MTDYIHVPIIEITGGWTVDEIENENDCDDAFAVLTAIIVSIEAKMDTLEMERAEKSESYIKTKSALRWKKAALSVVNTKRGKFKRQRAEAIQKSNDERVLRYFKAMHYDIYMAAQRHVDAGTDAT